MGLQALALEAATEERSEEALAAARAEQRDLLAEARRGAARQRRAEKAELEALLRAKQRQNKGEIKKNKNK